MKTSESREQQLFLVAGGIILAFIIGVVVFNMVQESAEDNVTDANVSPRPVVTSAMPAKEATKKTSWIDGIAPAPVFSAANDSPSFPPITARVVENQKDLPIKKSADGQDLARTMAPSSSVPAESGGSMKALGSWFPNAGALEAVRQVLLDDETFPIEAASSDDGRSPGEYVRPLAVHNHTEEREFPPGTAPGLLSTALNASPMLRLRMSPVPSKFPPSVASANKIASIRSSISADPGYWVRLASFASEKNAFGLLQDLSVIPFESGEMPASKSDIIVNDQIYYRIQVGPFSNHAQADRAAHLVRRRVNMTGIIISPRP